MPPKQCFSHTPTHNGAGHVTPLRQARPTPSGAARRLCTIATTCRIALCCGLCLALTGCGGSPTPSDASQPPAAAPSAAAPAAAESLAVARFADQPQDSGTDQDGDGLFEMLRVDLVLDISQAGALGIDATLATADGQPIALGSLDPLRHRTAPAAATHVATGRHTIALYFSGQDIRASAADGPFTVQISLTSPPGSTPPSASFRTQPYNHRAFQGLAFELRGVSDQGVRAGAETRYQALRVRVALHVQVPAHISVLGQLFAGDTHLGDAERSVRLDAGDQTVTLDFAGAAIAASGRDGPYTVHLTISDTSAALDQTHTTSAYRAEEF